MFYNMALNPHCPIKDPRVLMTECSLSEISEMLEIIEMNTAMESAMHEDAKDKIKKTNPGG